MNKKLRQLAKDAGFEVDHPKWIFANDPTGEGECHEQLEQFAKLLLKECAEWIKNTDSDPDIGEDDANAFLLYFGVR